MPFTIWSLTSNPRSDFPSEVDPSMKRNPLNLIPSGNRMASLLPSNVIEAPP